MARRSIVGLSGPFSRAGRGHCPRCGKSVDATWPWAGWGRLRKAYFGGLVVLVCLSPVWMADMSVMLPSALVFVSAVGPVNALAKIRPTCLRCGSVVENVRADAVPSHAA